MGKAYVRTSVELLSMGILVEHQKDHSGVVYFYTGILRNENKVEELNLYAFPPLDTEWLEAHKMGIIVGKAIYADTKKEFLGKVYTLVNNATIRDPEEVICELVQYIPDFPPKKKPEFIKD